MKIILVCLLILIINVTANSQTPDVNDFVVEGNLALSQEKYTDGINQFDMALKIDPKNYMSYYGKAVAYEKMAKYDTAMFNIKKTLNYKPDFSKAHYLCGLIRYEQKQFSKCIFDFEKATKYERNLLEAILLRAYAKEKIGMYKEAAIDFNIMSEKMPENRTFPLMAAISLIKDDSCYSAANLIKLHIQKYPDYDTAYFYCGIAYQILKQYDSAITYFTKTLEVNPNYFEAMNFRGRTVQQRDSTSAENDDLKNWKLIKPDAVKYFMDTGYELFFEKDYRNARNCFYFALSFDSLNSEIFFNIANCSIELGFNWGALYNANKCLEFDADNIDADLIKLKIFFIYYNQFSRIHFYVTYNSRYGIYLREFYFNYEKYIDSIEKITDKLLEINPKNYECYTILGDVYRYEDEYRKSKKYYNKALEIFEDPEIYYKKAILFAWDKDYEEALKEIAKALTLDPENKKYLIYKIQCIANDGNEIKANKMFEELIENEMDLSDIYYQRGLIKFYSFKNYRAALTDMDKAIELDPYNAEAYDIRSDLKYILDDEVGGKVDRKLYEKYKGKI